jgi:23S rRNA (uracil1939-C5)-methyltransferase
LHEPYERQLARKEELVRGALAPLGATVAAIVGSPARMGYRTSVKLCLHEDRDGRRAVGLYRHGTKDVVPLVNCPAQAAAINRVVERLGQRNVRPPARFYNHASRVFQRGRLKFLTLRASPADGRGSEAPVALIVSHTGVERAAIARWLEDAGLRGLCAYTSELNARDGDAVTGRWFEHASGPATFPYTVAGHRFHMAPASFFQANYALVDALVGEATAFAASGDLLLDLYGGFGAYALSVAARFRGLRIVDANKAAIEAAQRAIKDRGLADARAVATTCEGFFEDELGTDADRVTHVLVNPPRGGLSRRVVASLAKLPRLSELRYVSCNPSSLARDAKLLEPLGLLLRTARPFDMFPQTEHVEVVAAFSRA